VLLHALGPLVPFLARGARSSFDGSKLASRIAVALPPVLGALSAGAGLVLSFPMIEERYSSEAVTLVPLSYGALFLAAAVLVRRRSLPFSIGAYAAIGLAFLAIAAPVYYEGEQIEIAWAAVAAAAAVAARVLRSRGLALGGVALLSLATARFFAVELPEHFTLTPEIHYAVPFARDAVARWITALSLLAAGIASGRLGRWIRTGEDRLPVPVEAVILSASAAAFFLFTNIETASFFHERVPPARAASLSVLWTAWSVGLLAAGFLRGLTWVRAVAIALFAATIAKVFLKDMAGVDAPFRIVSFVVLGIVLIAVSWVYHRYRDRILRLAPSRDGEDSGPRTGRS